MGLRRYIVLLAAALLFQPGYAARALDVDSLEIYTEEYPPYNFMDGPVVKGIATEKVLRVLKRLGSKIKRSDIRLGPWARGYNAVLRNKNAVIYSMSYARHRIPFFKWVCPVGSTRIGLLGLRERNITIRSGDDLPQYRIGTVREDIGHELIKKIVPGKSLDIANSSVLNIRKLQSGRIDLFAYDFNVAYILLRRLQLDPADYEEVYVLEELPLCIGFNKEADDELVAAFQWELDAVNAEEENGQQ